MDLNSISSNLLLVGLILISLCCLYLLYSNFSKVREIEDLKRRMEDLKKIFLNQQLHNDETFSKINTILFQTLGQPPITPPHPEIPTEQALLATPETVNRETAKELMLDASRNTNTSNHTKVVSIDSNQLDVNITNLGNSVNRNVIINKEGHEDSNKLSSNMENKESDQKEINIDLHDLDELDDASSHVDENCEEIDIDNMMPAESSGNLGEDDLAESVQDIKRDINKDNIFNLDVVNNINSEIFDDLEDTLSIATEPIGDFNDVINNHTNFNLDEIKDIDDLDIDLPSEDIESSNTKNIVINSSNDIDIDTAELDDILNGNQVKQASTTEKISTENVKKIDINTPPSAETSTLNSMSIKQLKDIAKSHKLKSTGSKHDLINTILSSGITI
jgi:hypothetical protein